MLSEHKQGRQLIKQMQESIADKAINRKAFVSAASSYVNLLRNHIEKENTILFPMGNIKLTAIKQKELLNEFENLEKNVIGEGKHEVLHALLEKFREKNINIVLPYSQSTCHWIRHTNLIKAHKWVIK